MNQDVAAFMENAKNWKDELIQLRKLLLACDLTESLKWGKPCYAHANGNVAIIIPLKEHVALSFFKGALLADPEGILSKPGQNTQSGKWIKFKNAQEISALETILLRYLKHAIEMEKAGLKVVLKKTEEHAIPAEFQAKLTESPELKLAFDALTPGRQRAYLLFFSAPKQSQTRSARIEKCRQRILEGKGLNDL